MKLSQAYWNTYKEVPSDAEIPSHRLMLRAGLIYKTGNGLYTILPMGLRVVRKIEKIVREEMDRIGGMEILPPMVTPGELWKESKRWETMGNLMLKAVDRNDKDVCLSPTNEETFTDIFRRTVNSYKQLPLTLYQINTKYRDEIRPRYGVIRAREFIMKDAYSFHEDKASLDDIYDQMFEAYTKILKRIGLDFLPVEADGGAIADGEAKTHEFQVLADTGEDLIIFSKEAGYAANIERANTLKAQNNKKPAEPLQEIETPGKKTILEVSKFLNLLPLECLKCLVYKSVKEENEEFVIAVLEGDDELNDIKLKNYLACDHLSAATDNEIKQLGLSLGFIGPHSKTKITLIYDKAVNLKSSYCSGANKSGYHAKGFVPERDSSDFSQVDLRSSQAGDLDPIGKFHVEIKKGIEVGHIFQLGDKYTKALLADVLNSQGKKIHPLMGCYGIGVTRIAAAAIEQCHDENGIIWPKTIAPFQVHLIVISKSDETKAKMEAIYNELLDAGVEVLYDDRKLGPGFKFKDADLLGCPLKIVLGERDFNETGLLEAKSRDGKIDEKIRPEDVLNFCQKYIHD